MLRNGIRAFLAVGVVGVFMVGVTFAQECPQQTVQAPPAPAPATTSLPATPSFESPQFAPAAVTPVTIGQLRALRNSARSMSADGGYFQALASMSPMNLQADHAAMRAMVIQQNQARMARRSALREPARERMREENAHRYFEAGARAEAEGHYAKARSYYRRSVRVGASEASRLAQDALDQLTGNAG